MRNLSFAVTSTPPLPADDTGKPAPARRRARSAARPRNASSTIREAIEIAGETLWVILLFLVIGFVIAKAPRIDAAIDEIGGAHAAPPSSPADASRDSAIRDLQARFARYEARIAPIEKGYAQLEKRHADLLEAYAQLRKARVPDVYETSVASARPAAAP